MHRQEKGVLPRAFRTHANQPSLGYPLTAPFRAYLPQERQIHSPRFAILRLTVQDSLLRYRLPLSGTSWPAGQAISFSTIYRQLYATQLDETHANEKPVNAVH